MSVLQRELEHLQVLVEIKASRSEKKAESKLAVVLIGLLVIVYDDDDYDKFFVMFLDELEKAYQKLDPNGDYGDLIDAELAVQRNYLLGFVNDLKGGRISEAQAEARAGQYALSLGKLKERIELERYDNDTLLQWVINEEVENCPDCIQVKNQIHPVDYWKRFRVPKDGQSVCGSRCYCRLVRVK